MRSEPESIAKGARQQAGSGRGADEGERRDLQRDCRCAGTLANDDVDPKILHCQVEHLLSRPGRAVNLVEEEHLTRLEAGQHRSDITGMLKCRAGCDSQGSLELCSDDERKGGLAETRGPADEHMICGASSSARSLENETELRLHSLLAHEPVKVGRPKRPLDRNIFRVRLSIDDAFAHERSRLRSAALSKAAISGAPDSP
ncbi:unannotated protein [freshwater metagenome]|uniref:Unannotated protein n=1 Tax=freshwater metagenome TaxID=449393 RepID=A0A6J7ICL4_9ZZZZ